MRQWILPGTVLAAMAFSGCGPSVAYRQEAISEFEVGHIARAKPMFGQALQQAPSDPVALYYMGRIHCEEQDWENAIYYFQCCLDVDPGNADARAWLLKSEDATQVIGERLRFIPLPPARK